MSFLYPLGFLGLLAIPVLILIYIIKNKYTEQVVASTYLWTLSERFLKRKNPVNKITGIISLILQILAVTAISFAIAHPVFTMRGAAEDYCFVLDGSGSMNIENGGKTRLENGISRIRQEIKGSVEGSSYTIVYTGDYAAVVCEKTQDKTLALKTLDEIEPCYTATDPADALKIVQTYFDQTPSMKIFLYTDKAYDVTENVAVVNLSSREKNYALADVDYVIKNGGAEVTGTAFSYESNANLTVEVYCDDQKTPASSVALQVEQLVGAPFTLTVGSTDFASLRVRIAQSDALALDNEVVLYKPLGDVSFRTLIVSKDEIYLKAALSSMGIQYTLVDPEQYRNQENEQGGYGLYIFNGYAPKVLPRDGAVWFINPPDNTPRAGFTVLNRETLASAGKMVYSTSSSTRVRKLLENVVVADDMYVKSYARCGFDRDFTSLLSYDGNPLLFVGSNDYGNREAVFAFGLGEGDFAMSANLVILVRNLIGYTFPAMIDGTKYTCGDVAVINVMKNATSIKVETPSGKQEFLDSGVTAVEYTLKEVGVYTFTQNTGATQQPSAKIYCELAGDERMPSQTAIAYVVGGEAVKAHRDGVYTDLLYLFIFLAAVIIADWMVYCYEQYQLR